LDFGQGEIYDIEGNGADTIVATLSKGTILDILADVTFAERPSVEFEALPQVRMPRLP